MIETISHPNPGACQALENVKDILLERGSQYGPATEHFSRTCMILEIMFPKERLEAMVKSVDNGDYAFKPSDWALIMICDKLARLSNPRTFGKDVHSDTIDDIIGYAALLRDLNDLEHE